MSDNKERDSLRSKLALAEEALEFYADEDNWYRTSYCNESHIDDNGKRARTALAKLRKK